MTAKEARSLMGANEDSEDIKRFYKSVEERIMKDRSCSKITYSADLLTRAGADFLKTQGYNLELIPDWRDGDYYNISW